MKKNKLTLNRFLKIRLQPVGLDKLIEKSTWLSSRQKTALQMYLDGKTYHEIGVKLGLTGERARQICNQSVRRFNVELKRSQIAESESESLNARVYEMKEEIEFLKNQIRIADENIKPLSSDGLNFTMIEDCHFDVRAYNCLKSASINTVADIMLRTPHELMALRNFGKKMAINVQKTLYDQFGIKWGQEM